MLGVAFSSQCRKWISLGKDSSIGNLSDNDAQYWAQLPYWSADEAVALSLGKRGDIDVSSFRWGLNEMQISRRKRQIERAIKNSDLDEAIRPADFMTWAMRYGIDIPPNLRSQIEAHHAMDGVTADALRSRQLIKELKTEVERSRAELSAPENPKVVGSLERMVLGMAMKKFGYRPGAALQPAVSNIVNLLAVEGLTVGDDTVRRRLREAERHLATPLDKSEIGSS
jgi:hypothetical protein